MPRCPTTACLTVREFGSGLDAGVLRAYDNTFNWSSPGVISTLGGETQAGTFQMKNKGINTGVCYTGGTTGAYFVGSLVFQQFAAGLGPKDFVLL